VHILVIYIVGNLEQTAWQAAGRGGEKVQKSHGKWYNTFEIQRRKTW
jgi:hypothetical protein